MLGLYVRKTNVIVEFLCLESGCVALFDIIATLSRW
jgi:hypothetical protein